jgi:hypothetical protein
VIRRDIIHTYKLASKSDSNLLYGYTS